MITFEQAKAQYVHRFTMDHCPVWARHPAPNGRYYAPQYASDAEWYGKTLFPPNNPFAMGKRDTSCYSSGPSWPLGEWLTEPYSVAGRTGIAARVRRENRERRYWAARGVVTV